MTGIDFLSGLSEKKGQAIYLPNGSNKNPGTQEALFRSIVFSITQLKPGDTLNIYEGTYREVFVPEHSGNKKSNITIQAAEDQRVIISGTEPITNWKRYRGNIYSAKMDWDLGKNNQVFFDDKPLTEARWPNDLDGDSMTPNGAMNAGGGSATVHNTFEDEYALRQGNWANMNTTRAAVYKESEEYLEKRGLTSFRNSDASGLLFNLAEDPGQSKNLYLEYPERVEQLSELLQKYLDGKRGAPYIP
ncbi:MAG: hypothetical protein AB3N64_01390 [Puniceicoccaceae bacterium]